MLGVGVAGLSLYACEVLGADLAAMVGVADPRVDGLGVDFCRKLGNGNSPGAFVGVGTAELGLKFGRISTGLAGT